MLFLYIDEKGIDDSENSPSYKGLLPNGRDGIIRVFS